MLKSTNKFSGFVFALSLLVGLSGCGDETTSNNSVPNQSVNKKATIQGGVFDATTGARIGGDDLSLTLVQGTSHRTPNVLVKDTTKPLVGEYAFSDVPVNIDAGNITFKMVITNTNYQRFEGLVTFPVPSATIAGTTDSIINIVRDVYLFPVGATAPDIEVAVSYSGEEVIGATVMLQQNAAANSVSITTSGGTRLAASPGLLPTLSAVTALNADGVAVATFSGASLVLGGAYTPVVLPVTHEGTPLARQTLAQIFAGTSVSPIAVAMTDIVPGANNDGLHVVFASNRNVDDLVATGALSLVFNRDIALPDATAFPFTVSITQCLPNTGPCTAVVTASVTPVLTNSRTLTLTPVFSTAVAATDLGLQVTFAGGAVTIPGENEAVSIFGTANMLLFDGSQISGIVNILGR